MAEFLSLQPPDIDSFIRNLNSCKGELNESVGNALEAGAKEIEQEQKRIISQKSRRLSNYIKRKASKTTKGKMRYSIGYIYDKNNIKDVMPGLVFEFGRPGKSKNRGTIEREVNGKTYTVRNGHIEEFSHIRRGFDNKVEKVMQGVQEAFNKVVDSLGD